MKRVILLALFAVLAIVAVGCGGKPDPLVGDWKSQDATVDISFHVAAPVNGTYNVTWANPSQATVATPDPTASTAPPVVTFKLKKTNATVYTESDGGVSTFTLIGDSVVSVQYTGVDGSTYERNFTKK